MSAFLLGLGFRACMGSRTRKLVLLKLIDACEDDGTRIFPAVDTVARAAECSGRQVQRELRLFEEKGLLRLVRQGGKRPGDTNEYALDLDMLHAIAKVGWNAFFGAAADGGEMAESAADMGDTMSPIATDDADVMGDISEPMGDTSVTPMGDMICHPTPPYTPPLDPSVERGRERGDGRTTADDEPAESAAAIEKAFWRLVKGWPGFDGMPKKPALAAWTKLSPEDRAQAADRFPRWLALLKAQRKSHVPAPSTYFDERLWQDLPDKPAAPDGPKVAAPYGKAWMAERFADLLRPAYGAVHGLTVFERSMVDSGRATADGLMREKIRKSGWPTVNTMHQRAADLPPKGWAFHPEIAALADGFQQVNRDGPLYAAWRREHERRGWPFLDETRPPEWVWFPAVAEDWRDHPDAAVGAALDDFSISLQRQGYGHDAA